MSDLIRSRQWCAEFTKLKCSLFFFWWCVLKTWKCFGAFFPFPSPLSVIPFPSLFRSCFGYYVKPTCISFEVSTSRYNVGRSVPAVCLVVWVCRLYVNCCAWRPHYCLPISFPDPFFFEGILRIYSHISIPAKALTSPRRGVTDVWVIRRLQS